MSGLFARYDGRMVKEEELARRRNKPAEKKHADGRGETAPKRGATGKRKARAAA